MSSQLRTGLLVPILLLASLPIALTGGPSATGLDAVGSLEPMADDGTEPRMEDLLATRLAQGPVPVILHFDRPAARDAAHDLLPHAHPFRMLPALSLPLVGPEDLPFILDLPGLRFVEAADKPLEPALASARTASRAANVTDAHPNATYSLRDANGQPIDGRGVGVAIVDSGVDATHPDLADRIASTWLATPTGVFGLPTVDPISPHGTHVAGIVAGTGSVDPRARGVAPAASLHVFDHGPQGTNLHAAHAFDWILAHKDDVEPPIRVVVNAWGCNTGVCRTFDPEQAHNRLASALAENGTIVIFAAGNQGGHGFLSTVNPEGTNPTPGIFAVAEQTDGDIGTRETCATKTSSVGALGDPTTWPDIAVPGAWTWSPNGIHLGEDGRTPVVERKAYSYFHGTSAAAAHLGGIAALALQADPDLSPWAFEHLVKAHAEKVPCQFEYVRADATHPWGGTHPRMGHGLVDAVAIVEDLLEGYSVPQEEPGLEEVPPEWLDRQLGTAVETEHYLTGDGGLSPDAPTGMFPAVFPVSVDSPVVFTSAPLTAGRNASAARIDLWWGTFAECVCLRITAPRYGATLEVLHENGTATPLGTDELNPWYVHPAAPTQRPLDLLFPEITFIPGDRLRLTVAVLNPPSIPLVTTDYLLYADAATTSSRVALGDARGVTHGDPIWCQIRQDCTDIGGDRITEGLHCDSVPVRVEWRGPRGSSIVLDCSAAVLGCAIPLDAPDGSSCSNDLIINPSQLGEKMGTCRYTTLDDSRTGNGRCQGLLPRSSGD